MQVSESVAMRDKLILLYRRRDSIASRWLNFSFAHSLGVQTFGGGPVNINKVLVVGSGTLGQQIGFQCAMHGFATTMYDLRGESLESCRASHRQYAELFRTQRGKSTEE